MGEKIKLKVTNDRKYIINKELQNKYGFLPGKTIVFVEEDNKLVGKVV